jgi:hypothetical protein
MNGSVTGSECIAGESGGFVVAGGFSGAAVFGAETFKTAGETWVFIARYDASRTLQWVKVVPGVASGARGLALAADGSGDLLATGEFSGAASFGTTTLTSAGSSDAWLARLSGTGDWRWAKRAGGAAEDYGRGIAADASGYATSGSFNGVATQFFGAGALTSAGGCDVYAAKFRWDDSPAWLQRIGGSSDEEGAKISATRDGAWVLAGSFAGTISFGSHTQTSGGARDMMIARLRADGTPGWLAGAMGGAGDDVGYACATDLLGNVFFAGSFVTAAPFGYDVAVSATSSTAPGQAEIVWGKIHATSEPNEDSDGDGQPNAAELNSGTDPLNAGSSLRFTQFSPARFGRLLLWRQEISELHDEKRKLANAESTSPVLDQSGQKHLILLGTTDVAFTLIPDRSLYTKRHQGRYHAVIQHGRRVGIIKIWHRNR